MAVACARNAKFASVKVIDKYELNVLRRSDPTSLDKKNGVAVISTTKHLSVTNLKSKPAATHHSKATAPLHQM